MLHRLETGKKIVGTKQTIKALEKDMVQVVYIAEDADERIIHQILDLAKNQDVPVITVETMVQLGKKCNIEVKTATAAIIH